MTEHVDINAHSLPEQVHEAALMSEQSSPPHTSGSSDISLKERKDLTDDVDAEQTTPVDVYPGDHGDWRAIVSCIGAFFTLFIGFGILNIPGTFQTYWENNQLAEYPPGEIGWIAATQFFLTLFGSVFTGRFFDLYGGKVCRIVCY